MSGSASWSLVRRVTWWLTLAATVPFVVAVLVGGVFIHSAASREVQLFAHEELEEASAILRSRAEPAADVATVTREIGSDHVDMPMAWRLRNGGEVLAVAGDRQLFDSHGLSPALPPEPRELSVGVVFDSLPVRDGLVLELVLDGAAMRTFVADYWSIAVSVAVFGLLLGFAASRFVARCVGGLLDRVAAGVRAAHPETAELASLVGAMPLELRGVVGAMQAELDSIRREAERVRVFTAGLAHELRSPIQNLIGQAEVALLRPRDDAHYQRLLADQLHELHELAGAVDNLLGLCTVQAERFAECEEFDLAAEVGLRLSRERSVAERRGIELVFDVAGDLRMVGDREGVLRGLRNVVANAVDWTPTGSRAVLTMDGTGADIVMTVDDAGPGIPEEERERVFDAFYRGRPRDRTRVGYGIGLALTREMIEAHHGTVDIGSSPLGGARVRLQLGRLPPDRRIAAGP